MIDINKRMQYWEIKACVDLDNKLFELEHALLGRHISKQWYERFSKQLDKLKQLYSHSVIIEPKENKQNGTKI